MTSRFRFWSAVEARFRDTDAMGHVNNSVYLTYLEIARMHYWRQLFGPRAFQEAGFILARVEIDFRAPAFAGERLRVGLRAERLGTKSFDFAYEIWRGIESATVGEPESPAAELLASATSVQVAYDYAAQRSVAVSSAIRVAIEAFENSGAAQVSP